MPKRPMDDPRGPETALTLTERFWMIEHRLAFAHETKLVWRRGNLASLELLARSDLRLQDRS
jgi:hypothetical protein